MKLFEKSIHVSVAIALLVSSLAGLGVYFYMEHLKKNVTDNMLSAIAVEVDKVRRGSLTRELTVVGNLAATSHVVVKPNVRGQISKVYVQPGAEVRQGDALFEIDDRSFKAKLKEAQAVLTLANVEYKRAEQLKEKNFAAAKTLDTALSNMLKAEAAVEGAQKELEDTKITAPYEGVVSLHKISPGASVGPETELLTITDVDPIKVDFKVPALFLPFLYQGQKVVLASESMKDQQFAGEVDAIDATVDPASQQIALRASVANDKRVLKPGLFVKVKLSAGSSDNALIIPVEALEVSGEATSVYKVIEHPQKPGIYVAFRVPVLTGIRERETVEILKGIQEDDIIVTVGQQRLADGVPVTFDLASVGLGPQKPLVEEKTTQETSNKKASEEKSLPSKEDDKNPQEAKEPSADEKAPEAPLKEESFPSLPNDPAIEKAPEPVTEPSAEASPSSQNATPVETTSVPEDPSAPSGAPPSASADPKPEGPSTPPNPGEDKPAEKDSASQEVANPAMVSPAPVNPSQPAAQGQAQ
jgi:membrane fusion protein (multidrug efflux system)